MLLVVAAAVLAAGLMIGLTGIGGVLVVPALTALGGIALDRAVAASLLAFLVSGAPAAVVHLRRTKVPAAQAIALCACAGLGALAGALSFDWLPGHAVKLFIALLAISSGAYALTGGQVVREGGGPRIAVLAPLTLAVGYASAISGTGGPVTLVPVLLLLGVAARTAIALGLAVQIPVSALASAVYFAKGRVDLELAAAITAVMMLGMAGGTWLSARLSAQATMRAVATVLIAVGIAYGVG